MTSLPNTTPPSERLRQLGLVLPKPWAITPTAHAAFVRVVGRRVMISGHLPIDGDGKLCGPYGRVGAAVTEEEAIVAARRAMLGILASLVRELGSLDRVAAWVQLFGMVNAAPTFNGFPQVIDAASILVNDIFGPQIGRHSRVAIGVGGLPFDAPVEVQAELEIHPE